MFSLECVASVILLLQVTQGVVLDSISHPRQHCCYGDETYQHSQVVLTLQRVCMQLVCDDGQVVRRYLNDQPGNRDCCEFDGQLYFQSTQLSSHCITLQCRDSCWHPVSPIADCCSTCSVYDDPHFHTFDGHRYDFHGFCNYSLAQRTNMRNPDVGVFSDFTSCFGKASCLAHTTFRDNPNTVITLSNGALFDVQVNGHPFHVTPGKIHALKSAEGCHPVLAWRSPWQSKSPSCLTLFGSSRIMIQHCQHRLDVITHPSHTDQLDGLCGHFNSHMNDDFTDRENKVHPLSHLPLAFPTSWMTADQSDAVCQAPCRGCKAQNTTDPCTATPQQRRVFLDRCNRTLSPIIKKSPHLAYHIDDCSFDLCVMEAYGRKEEMDNWLGRVVDIVNMAVHLNTSRHN